MSSRSPACSVVVDGQDIGGLLGRRLMSFSLTSKRGDEADQLNLAISDHDGRMAIPPSGASIALALGWRGEALKNMGTFKADEPAWDSSPGVISVRARSADFTSSADLRTRRERSWRATTLGAILRQVAGGAGLTPRISAELDARPIQILAQSRESDVAFLRRLGREYDAVATIKAGALIFGAVGAGETTSGKPLAELQLTKRDGDRASWRAVARDKYDGVTAAYREGGKRHTVHAGENSSARRLKTVYANKADAERAAQAEWKRTQRGAAEMTYTLAEGRADIHPECKVRFTGLKPQIDATTWLVRELTHTVGDTGFTTSLQLENAI